MLPRKSPLAPTAASPNRTQTAGTCDLEISVAVWYSSLGTSGLGRSRSQSCHQAGQEQKTLRRRQQEAVNTGATVSGREETQRPRKHGACAARERENKRRKPQKLGEHQRPHSRETNLEQRRAKVRVRVVDLAYISASEGGTAPASARAQQQTDWQDRRRRAAAPSASSGQEPAATCEESSPVSKRGSSPQAVGEM